jgi:hypothetical protein
MEAFLAEFLTSLLDWSSTCKQAWLQVVVSYTRDPQNMGPLIQGPVVLWEPEETH